MKDGSGENRVAVRTSMWLPLVSTRSGGTLARLSPRKAARSRCATVSAVMGLHPRTDGEAPGQEVGVHGPTLGDEASSFEPARGDQRRCTGLDRLPAWINCKNDAVCHRVPLTIFAPQAMDSPPGHPAAIIPAKLSGIGKDP